LIYEVKWKSEISENIFCMDLLDNLDKLPEDKTIVLICYVGHTASQMLVALRLLGYDVIALKFGMGLLLVREFL
jgi:rhodanese-related sulfurtransferase